MPRYPSSTEPGSTVYSQPGPSFAGSGNEATDSPPEVVAGVSRPGPGLAVVTAAVGDAVGVAVAGDGPGTVVLVEVVAATGEVAGGVSLPQLAQTSAVASAVTRSPSACDLGFIATW